jgi:tetratricopeptide (TPR) repeat protein
MISLILMFVVALPAAYFTYTAGEGNHWALAPLAFIGASLVVSIPINLWVRKRLMAVSNALQAKLQEAQETIRRKVMAMANKGMSGSPKLLEQLEREQESAVRNALPILDQAKPLQKWSVMAKKQIDLMRGQLLYQIRDYDAARPLLQNAMAFDPLIICMQMVLAWRADHDDKKTIDKLFKRGISRFKYDKAVLIYALYSWILVKQERITEAVEALDKGKEKTSDPVITQNWEHLVNNQLKRFSFAGLGDQWYALGLEQPPQVKQRQQQAAFGGRVNRGNFR